jgi:hypothetical protein
VITIVLVVISGLLFLTVVGSIVALPLMVVAAITGFTAWHKFRRHWHH